MQGPVKEVQIVEKSKNTGGNKTTPIESSS